MSPSIKFSLKLIFGLFLFLHGSVNLIAQYHFDHWTTDDGLPQNGVRAITQTPDGYLWFTTFDGLVRFDGARFTTFNKGNTKGIINNRFTDLFCDQDGTLYATTMEDGVLTIYRNGAFTSYNSAQVPERYIKLIKPDENGELLFLVDTGDYNTETWYHLRNGEFVFKERKEKNENKIIFQGKTDAIWTVTPTEITETRSWNVTVYPHKTENLSSTITFFEDSGGGFWLGGKTLTRLKGGKIEQFGEKDGLAKDSDYHSFWEEADGGVWFASGGRVTSGLGLVLYKDGKFSIFGKESGLSNTRIHSIFKDREGVVWLATDKGLNRLRKQLISSIGAPEGLTNGEVYPILRDREEKIWVGTAKGLNLYRNGKFEAVNFKQKGTIFSESVIWENGRMAVQSLFEDANGKLWIGVAGGIYIAQNGEIEMLKVSEGHHVHSFLQDGNGKIWAATSKGILVFNDYKLEKFYTVKDGLPNEFMSIAFKDSKGNLWFGGFGGLSEFKDGKFINYTTENGLTGNYIRSIYEDAEGTFWIGTYDEGLSRLKDGKFTNFKEENGLFSNGVFAIEEDRNGTFWISSNRGIYRVRRSELNDFAAGKLDKISAVGYGREDGMLSNECNGGRQPASMRDREGNFWFPTQEGIAVVHPELENYNSLPPSVVIESAAVERENHSIKDGLIIEPGQKNIEINFTGISMIKSAQIKFKYKLEGHDADWIDAGTKRTAYYSYLPPGNYRFLVKAANSDGIWNEQGASLEIRLKPFFYQMKLFYIICAAVFVCIILGTWKLSVYRLEMRERKLAKLVDEKTEELRRANEELKLLANSDGLTKIGNRRRFEEFLQDEWHRAIRFKTEISLVLLDVDHFKLYNDTYGHQAGDDCLKQIAAALLQTIHRPTDLLARFGGEEFAIILGGTDLQGALNIAKQAVENVKNLQIPHSASQTSEFLTISVGVATTFVTLGMPEAELIKAADDALYKAKATGRNRIISKDLTLDFNEKTILDEEIVEIV